MGLMEISPSPVFRHLGTRGGLLAKPNYQFEKRQRDLAKKSKQEEKRRQKLAAKSGDCMNEALVQSSSGEPASLPVAIEEPPKV